jgi:S-adenosylmethionine:tRNA ribosyltransferase-isomerase
VKIDLFDYDLPPDRVAQEPAAPRDTSRLMVFDRPTGETRHRLFRDLPDLLRPGDLIVVNRSRVFPARLLGKRQGGGNAEILLVRRTGPQTWQAFVRPGRRLRRGQYVQLPGGLRLTIDSDGVPGDGRREVSFQCDPEEIAAAIERLGHPPLPPYIKRPAAAEDRERYQTVYAKESGSVAAPTAGLHFTETLIETIRSRGISFAEVVLHVGPGTFQPVQVDDTDDHRVAAEPYEVPEATARAIADARVRGGRVVAVGTTTVRTLESAATPSGAVVAGVGETDLVVAPGFSFRVVDALLTNFHLPRSSLLLLVSAFGGRENVLAAYRKAVEGGYRFYSYGDAMLLA